jgi:hypothetical protein
MTLDERGYGRTTNRGSVLRRLRSDYGRTAVLHGRSLVGGPGYGGYGESKTPYPRTPSDVRCRGSSVLEVRSASRTPEYYPTLHESRTVGEREPLENTGGVSASERGLPAQVLACGAVRGAGCPVRRGEART